ncbi:hypothetical protein [Coleofasciculus sp. B1-GNL1-01]
MPSKREKLTPEKSLRRYQQLLSQDYGQIEALKERCDTEPIL